MTQNDDSPDFVVWMAKLGKTDRDMYRRIRARAWEMIVENHERMSPDELEKWRRQAS